jgi:hypothetical protein
MVISPTPLKSFNRSPPPPCRLAGGRRDAGRDQSAMWTPTSRPASKALPLATGPVGLPVSIRYVEAAALAVAGPAARSPVPRIGIDEGAL